MGAEKLLGGKIRLALPLYYLTLNHVPVASSRRSLFEKKKKDTADNKNTQKKTNKKTNDVIA